MRCVLLAKRAVCRQLLRIKEQRPSGTWPPALKERDIPIRTTRQASHLRQTHPQKRQIVAFASAPVPGMNRSHCRALVLKDMACSSSPSHPAAVAQHPPQIQIAGRDARDNHVQSLPRLGGRGRLSCTAAMGMARSPAPRRAGTASRRCRAVIRRISICGTGMGLCVSRGAADP